MGFFSWLDCKSKRSVKVGSCKMVYVLVPKQFRDKFGVRIGEDCYNGYGSFGSFDIYELVAFWNKEHLSEKMLEDAPKLSDFGGLWGFEKEAYKKAGLSDDAIKAKDEEARQSAYESFMQRRNNMIALLDEYKNSKSEKYLTKKYGDEWLREIGIAISCYTEQNERLPYPIKITYDGTAIYEDCQASESDDSQGCY